MIGPDDTRKIRINLTFTLSAAWLRAITSEDSGLALLRLQGDVDDEVRRSVRSQLRAILAELGGDPWHAFIAEPHAPWIEREQGKGKPMAPVVRIGGGSA